MQLLSVALQKLPVSVGLLLGVIGAALSCLMALAFPMRTISLHVGF